MPRMLAKGVELIDDSAGSGPEATKVRIKLWLVRVSESGG